MPAVLLEIAAVQVNGVVEQESAVLHVASIVAAVGILRPVPAQPAAGEEHKAPPPPHRRRRVELPVSLTRSRKGHQRWSVQSGRGRNRGGKNPPAAATGPFIFPAASVQPASPRCVLPKGFDLAVSWA